MGKFHGYLRDARGVMAGEGEREREREREKEATSFLSDYREASDAVEVVADGARVLA